MSFVTRAVSSIETFTSAMRAWCVVAAVLLACASPAFNVFAAETPAAGEPEGIEEKLDELENRIRKNPDDAQAIFKKATLLTEAGRVDEAQPLFEELIDRFPDLPEPYNNLAALYASQGRLEEAKNVLETLILSYPELMVAHENLAQVYGALALAEFEKALSLGAEPKETQKKIDVLLEVIEYVEPGGATEVTREVGEEKVRMIESRVPQANISGMTQFDMTPDEEDIKMVLENMAKALSKKKADRYLFFFSEDYSESEDLTPEQWRDQVRDEINSRDWIKASVTGTQVDMISDRHAVARFILEYSSDENEDVAKTVKEMTLKMIGGRWIITPEDKTPSKPAASDEAPAVVEPAQEEAPEEEVVITPVIEFEAAKEEAVQAPDVKEEVENTVRQWADTWEDGDIDKYGEFYAESFSSRGADKTKWLQSKSRKFRKQGNITVGIEDLNITTQGDRAVVSFTQRYNSETYSDAGVKTLIMIREGDSWKIEAEGWRALR